MSLNDLHVKNAKPTTSPYKLADGGGLYLHIKPSGTKSWRMDYRFASKRKTIARIKDHRGKPFGQIKTPLGRGQQRHATIRGDPSAVERRCDLLACNGWK